jgi:hypothetical protein
MPRHENTVAGAVANTSQLDHLKPSPPNMAGLMEAKVKSVLSGDTIILQGLKSSSERILSLAFVSAPRLKREGDEVRYKFISSSRYCMAREQVVMFMYSARNFPLAGP